MFSFEITTRFDTKSKEQAEYIISLYNDLHSLIHCENSHAEFSEIQEK